MAARKKKPRRKQKRNSVPSAEVETISFRVLGLFQIGEAEAAIEWIARSSKPIAEMCWVDLPGNKTIDDLEADIKTLLKHSVDGVKAFVRQHGPKTYSFGFYRFDWALEAMIWIDQNTDFGFTRNWMYGLVFGYEPAAIEHFLNKTKTPPPKSKGVIRIEVDRGKAGKKAGITRRVVVAPKRIDAADGL